MKLRMPAYPLITVDPYFSVWSFGNTLNGSDTVHWTGKKNRITGTVSVENEVYCFMGRAENALTAKQISADCTALSTVYKFACGKAVLTAKFTSPLLADDTDLLSRPVSFLEISVSGAENAVVNVSACEELCLDHAGQYGVTAEMCECSVPTVRMGSNEQPILKNSGDDVRIDYGWFYISAKGGTAEYGKENGMTVLTAVAEIKDGNSALFLFSYDDVYSIEYFGEKCRSLWNNDGKSILTAIEEAAEDYSKTVCKCAEFDKSLYISALNVGGEKYAELLEGSYRQIMCAHKLVVSPSGEFLWISKENSSNGCAATVDITYPTSPIFMLYNTELLKGSLRPVFDYAESDRWNYEFAPHDVGTYPLLNGQTYYECKLEYQMPVEECGNMLILTSAVALIEKNTDFVKMHKEILIKWAEYLEVHGLDPEKQLCSDDFAGHLAHNCNLSLKAICALAAFSKVCKMLGEDKLCEKYYNKAADMAKQWEKAAYNGENYCLAFDKKESFSLKYNLIWDTVMHLGLFDSAVAKKETECYIKKLNKYGPPLDNRDDYTKADWIIWCAAFAENKQAFNKLTEAVWNIYNETKDRAPMPDWYKSSTAEKVMFQARSVIGGFWMPMLDKADLFNTAEV